MLQRVSNRRSSGHGVGYLAGQETVFQRLLEMVCYQAWNRRSSGPEIVVLGAWNRRSWCLGMGVLAGLDSAFQRAWSRRSPLSGISYLADLETVFKTTLESVG